MSDFELDVTKPSGETVTITSPDGRHVYNVLPLTREPMLVFDELRRRDVDDGDLDGHASALLQGISALLATQNGGPPAREILEALWQDGYLGLAHLRQLSEHLLAKASGDPPA